MLPDVHAYLCSGSRILCTHWDSRRKHRKRSHGKFLHSDRMDYTLQLYMNNHTLHESYHGPPLVFMVLYEHTFIHTSALAVGPSVPTGTDTVSGGRGPTAGSSVLTGRATDCNMKQPCVSFMDKVLCCVWVHAWLCVDMHVYLCSGSRILCTHWDSHRKCRKRNCGKFLHCDRMDYRLQYEKHVLISWINCFGFGHAWLCVAMYIPLIWQ